MAFDGISINTLIGAGSKIKGDIFVNGMVRIDGDLEGSIEAPERIYIGSEARLRATVRARSVIVCGLVEGDIIAPEGVTVLSSGMVIGDIITRKLAIEDDVIFHGNCTAINDQETFDKALEKYNNLKALKPRLYR